MGPGRGGSIPALRQLGTFSNGHSCLHVAVLPSAPDQWLAPRAHGGEHRVIMIEKEVAVAFAAEVASDHNLS